MMYITTAAAASSEGWRGVSVTDSTRLGSTRLTDADHDGSVDLVSLVLGRVALDAKVGPQVALADLVKVLARERLEHLEAKK